MTELPLHDRPAARRSTLLRHGRWFASGLLLTFLLPFCLADLIEVPRDLYYGVYAAAVGVFFVLWARSTGQSLSAMLRRHLLLATVLGLAVGALLSVMVVQSEPATPHPSGLALAAAVLWRGVVYGAADGVLLSAFPILIVVAATGGRARRTVRGRLGTGVLALLASLVMTSVYHLGYPDFRSEKLAKPVVGDLVWSVPTLATLNPVGAPVAHAVMHVAAVLHASETDTFLPPHR
jgi:hypothetical protein